MKEIMDLIVSNGMSVVIIGYFLFKDYRFNENIINVLQEVKEVLVEIRHNKQS